MSLDVPVIDDAWILSKRGPKNSVDADRPYAFLVEDERGADGRLVSVATVFLTNRECLFACLMCDLWKNTTDEPIGRGAIVRQIRWALDRLPPATHIKLYNAGSFFDPGAIVESDYAEIAEAVSSFETVVVESHPKLVGRRCLTFREMIGEELHVAMGLETVHPQVLAKLNKRMTLLDFEKAVGVLLKNDMSVRTFVLVRPPFMTESEGVEWACRSIGFAFDTGVECCALLPTRVGNGAMEALHVGGHFTPPSLDSVEDAFDYGLSLKRGRVFVDLWDIAGSASSSPRVEERLERLSRMNLSQRIEPRVG
jgi:archaeosine synthase beta-subunit